MCFYMYVVYKNRLSREQFTLTNIIITIKILPHMFNTIPSR